MFRLAKNLLARFRKPPLPRRVPGSVPVPALPAYRAPAPAFPARREAERRVTELGEYEAGAVEEIALPVPRRPLDDWLLG